MMIAAARSSLRLRHAAVKNSILARGLDLGTRAVQQSGHPASRTLAALSVVVVDPSSQSSSSSSFSWLAAASVLTATVASSLLTTDRGSAIKSDCCGIVGVVGTSEHTDAREFLLDGLTILKNRGYDSAGLATISPKGGEMVITKYASDGDKADSIELVKDRSHTLGHTLGIAHTRWATHGGKTDENAHPHVDSSGKIALVHNGTLTNANEKRRELQALGHVFTSQTDTEVIVKLIGHHYSKGGLTLKEATEVALNECDGTWGLGIICTDNPGELIVACNGSPLVIGIGDDRTFIASETSAFNRFTKNFISMKDGEIGILHADGRTLDLSRKQLAPDQQVKLSPAPFPHWTLKELVEQPEAIARALGFGGRMSYERVLLGGMDQHEAKLKKIKHMTLSACGTSLNAARYGERIMKDLGSFNSVASLDAAETETKDFPCMNDIKSTGLIVVSQSGETKDVHRVVVNAMDKGVCVLSVVNAVGSLIARTTKLGVYCNAGRENAVASTKAFTTQVTVLALIALWFREMRDRLEGVGPSVETTRFKEALMRLPIAFGMALKTHDKCREIAKRLQYKEHCFVLGKGKILLLVSKGRSIGSTTHIVFMTKSYNFFANVQGYAEPVAYEGALKIKEMCYLHAEGYSGGALKHGPFALIEDETGKFGATPIIMFILDDQHAHHMRTAAEEVRARGAELIIITDKPELARDLDDDPIVIPQNGPMTALCGVLPLQLIAYELAMLR
jgi:glutamine---fructose-6-phosphate transaminase (isomerizing)